MRVGGGTHASHCSYFYRTKNATKFLHVCKKWPRTLKKNILEAHKLIKSQNRNTAKDKFSPIDTVQINHNFLCRVDLRDAPQRFDLFLNPWTAHTPRCKWSVWLCVSLVRTYGTFHIHLAPVKVFCSACLRNDNLPRGYSVSQQGTVSAPLPPPPFSFSVSVLRFKPVVPVCETAQRESADCQ